VTDLILQDAEDGGILRLPPDMSDDDTLIATYRLGPDGISVASGCDAGPMDQPIGIWLQFPYEDSFTRADLIKLNDEGRLKVKMIARDKEGRNLYAYGNWLFTRPVSMLIGLWSSFPDNPAVATCVDITVFALGKVSRS
jgi:hypothetical protein